MKKICKKCNLRLPMAMFYPHPSNADGLFGSCKICQSVKSAEYKRKKPNSYGIYWQAKDRCTNPNNKSYARYGGRGTEFRFLCFADFYNLMGDKPSGKTLDRIDSEGHYETGNLKWSTYSEQNLNRRYGMSEEQREAIRALGKDGLSQREIAKVFGVTQSTVSLVVNGKRRRNGKLKFIEA